MHADFQDQLVGSIILNSIWGFSNHYAWGIASANPFAVRALEKATRKRRHPIYTRKRLPTLQRIRRQIPYLRDAPIEIDVNKSIVDTAFYQDLSLVSNRFNKIKAKDAWSLGNIDEGQEWLGSLFGNRNKSDGQIRSSLSLRRVLTRSCIRLMSARRPATGAEPFLGETETCEDRDCIHPRSHEAETEFKCPGLWMWRGLPLDGARGTRRSTFSGSTFPHRPSNGYVGRQMARTPSSSLPLSDLSRSSGNSILGFVFTMWSARSPMIRRMKRSYAT